MTSSTKPIADDPIQLRQRAERARGDADRVVDPDAKKTLTEIADAYLRLAALAEAKLASKATK